MGDILQSYFELLILFTSYHYHYLIIILTIICYCHKYYCKNLCLIKYILLLGFLPNFSNNLSVTHFFFVALYFINQIPCFQ